ncbi:hypothetical protein A2U01_0114462, partial [Trifolium medium]|nr:hypothetical protein [Trifolium medium]
MVKKRNCSTLAHLVGTDVSRREGLPVQTTGEAREELGS